MLKNPSIITNSSIENYISPIDRLIHLINVYNTTFGYKIVNETNLRHMKSLEDEMYYIIRTYNLKIKPSLTSYLTSYIY